MPKLSIIALLLLTGCVAIPSRAGRVATVATVQPDPRVQWRSWHVAGMTLTNPAVTDSLGHPLSIVLPPGATLWLPFANPDSTTSDQESS